MTANPRVATLTSRTAEPHRRSALAALRASSGLVCVLALASCSGVDPNLGISGLPTPPLAIASVGSQGSGSTQAVTQAGSQGYYGSSGGSSAVQSANLAPPAPTGGYDAYPSASSGANQRYVWQTGPSGQPQNAAAARSAQTPPPAPTGQASTFSAPQLPPPPTGGNAGYDNAGYGNATAPGASPAPMQGQPASQPDTRLAARSPAPQLQPSDAASGTIQGERIVQFLPLTGAPDDKAALLARALATTARHRGITIRPANNANAPVRLKGYFSASTSGGQTHLTYIWDVVDANGERIRRFQGSQLVQGSGESPWDAIQADTLAAVADETLAAAGDLFQQRA